MKLMKLAALTISLVMSGIVQNAAQAAVLTPDDSTTNVAVLRVAGDEITRDELTSFATLLAQNEGYPPEGLDLIHAYIFSRLHDRIPTTATVMASTSTATYTPFPVLAQRNFLKRALREKLSREVEVPREDLQAWYDKNVDRYVQPERVRAWHIFMETSDENPTSAPATVRQKLEQAKTEIDSGTSFSEAARKYSEAASREKGGEIGTISPRQPIGPLNKPMNLELETVFFQLPPNKVSDVVETRHGMHLLYVTDKKTTATPTLDDLVTSGILPGALAQDVITSKTSELVQQTIARHNGKVLPGFSESDTIGNETVVFELGGRKTTINDLAQVFGERFTNYIESIKNDKAQFRKLMEQGMEDEATVLAAVDQGLANDPETSQTLQAIAQRAAATKRIQAIVEAEATVTEKDIQAKYEELLEQLRQPEAAGYVVQVEIEQSSGTAEQAKARDEALGVAEQLAEKMKTAEFAAIAAELQKDPALRATATEVSRHALNRSTETLAQQFDRAAVTVDAQVGVSKPIPLGDNLVLAKVEQRWPGEPVPLADVHDRIKMMLQSETQQKVRGELIKRLLENGLVEYLPAAADYGAPVEADSQSTQTANQQTTATNP